MDRRSFALAAGSSLIAFSLGGCGDGLAGATPAPTPAPTPTPTPVPVTMLLGPAVVVDQFGYIPGHRKIAVVRDPQVGFDASDSFTPGSVYDVVNAVTSAVVFTGAAALWNGGATDAAYGDKVWRFDFSSVTTDGEYYIRDTAKNQKSPNFKIGAAVYAPVLKAAVRYFYYQRAGQVKTAANAGANWTDAASHVGPGQDLEARLYSAKNDASTARDVSGGWYDAGDTNKYTAWAAGYVTGLLQAYNGNPMIWTEDLNIPESGNGIPDIVDEAKWGLNWLRKMQLADGSVLSIVGEAGATPPSSATGGSYYGPVNTTATLASAGALAIGAKVLGAFPVFASYVADIGTRAELAWAWADANPSVIFHNAQGSGLGAGEQETDNAGRLSLKLEAAIYLYDLTGKTVYKSYIDSNYSQAHLIAWSNYVTPYEYSIETALLHYASLPAATPNVASAIKNAFTAGMESQYFQGKITSDADSYLSYIPDYVWGSNSVKSIMGNLFLDMTRFGLGTRSQSENMASAAGYIHYIHGVNPFGKVYLSNMYSLGATNSVNEIWHTWFGFDSGPYRDAKTSLYGPAPGFLVGGPTTQYSWDSNCPSISSACGATPPSPPSNQPPAKSYKDFNDGWPLNSWPVSEVSNGYQVNYIRLLSRMK